MHAAFSRRARATSAALTPVCQFVFGDETPDVRWPVTHVLGRGNASQIISAPAADVRGIELDGRIVGRAYSDDDAEYCYLGGVLPPDHRAARPRQVYQCFEAMDRALQQAGMSFRHVVRTWIFLDQLLDWYGEFNAARTAFFREHGVFNHLVPASTGIGAANPAGAALVAGAIAIKPKSDRVRICAVQSPLQCPAIDYRSSFSRAVEVSRPKLRELYISGTASIAPDGTSAHIGDCARQVELTMKVIHAILRSRRMDWANATRMIAYFRDLHDQHYLNAWIAEHGLIRPPVIVAQETVCRDELLFELELDAAAAP